ncbi:MULTISPECIES: hypothetical protein [Herbaspirillum]|uniref:Uncharacterized protein n=2 Tax=Herbaspirillum huttiense TaxID=863372 RepID=A0AAJ2LSE5_9BURK|nr:MULTISPECIES: hypothetical protein [Herbaspirillum]MDR9837079.1 hypothetical protein [Herbaspirillum huttiense]
MNQQAETVKQEATRLGLSLNEVRRRRNASTPRKEVLRLVDGATYIDGHGDIVTVRHLPPSEQLPEGTKHVFICDETFRRYTEHGIYDSVNGPLVKFNLLAEASK